MTRRPSRRRSARSRRFRASHRPKRARDDTHGVRLRRNSLEYTVEVPAAWGVEDVQPLRQGSYATAHKCTCAVDGERLAAVLLCRPLDAFVETEDCVAENMRQVDCMRLPTSSYVEEVKNTRMALGVLRDNVPRLYHAQICGGDTDTPITEFRATSFGVEIWEYFEHDLRSLLRSGLFKDVADRDRLLTWKAEVCSQIMEKGWWYPDLHTANILVSGSLDRFALADLGSIGPRGAAAGCTPFNWAD